MGNINFFVIILNAILFSFIFWLLTFLCKYFYQDKYSNYKLNFYECGFKSISVIRLNISAQYLLIAIFLIVYDGEFLILFPAIFNMFSLNAVEFFILFYFMFLIFLTLLIDYAYSALDWNI